MSDETKMVAGPKFWAAFVKAQKQMRTAVESSTNPHFRSKYADYDDIVEAIREALTANGIGWSHDTLTQEGKAGARTYLIHESGEGRVCDCLFPMAPNAKPQDYGSAFTYAERYGLKALAGVPTGDDDGNAASGRGSPSPPRPPPHPNAEALRGKVAAALKPKPPAEMTPLEKMLAHGKEHGLSDAQTKQAIKSALGKGTVNPAELTDADVFTVAKHMQTEREASAS